MNYSPSPRAPGSLSCFTLSPLNFLHLTQLLCSGTVHFYLVPATISPPMVPSPSAMALGATPTLVRIDRAASGPHTFPGCLSAVDHSSTRRPSAPGISLAPSSILSCRVSIHSALGLACLNVQFSFPVSFPFCFCRLAFISLY